MPDGFAKAARPARRHRRLAAVVLVLALLVVGGFGAGLRGVVKDPSVDAFVPLDHPAALARQEARDVFGLEDPIVVALRGRGGAPAFSPAILGALRDLHEAVRRVPGVRKNDVLSIADRNFITGDEGDLVVEPVIPEGPIDAAAAATALARVNAMPMMQGLLASPSGDMVVMLVPVDDPNHAGDVHAEIVRLADSIAGPHADVHVAGVAAMNARLGAMVDGDTRVFVPAAIVVVFVVVFIALRRLTAVLGPLVVVSGAAAAGIGLMGWMDARYYLITTALPVIIMAIAVADSLHISGCYLKARRADPDQDAADAVRRALGETWLPVTLTTVTTVAGFLGLSFGAAMTPISEFGIYAAAGAAAAWGLSLTALPAILVLTDLRPREGAGGRGASMPMVDRMVGRLALASVNRPYLVSLLLVGLLAIFAGFATQAEFDYERKRYFPAGDRVRLDDEAINAALGGINFLDVLVTGDAPGSLMEAPAVAAMADLRQRIETLPGVAKTTGIDDYVSLMHGALTGAEGGALPDAGDAPAQYMFLFEASAPPDEFKAQIDYDHQRALLRAQLSTDRYRATSPVVRELKTILAEWSATTGLDARVSGRVAVNEGWMSLLARNHFVGLGAAALLVLMASVAGFRAFLPALVVMVPVAIGVLFVYALMGFARIDIAPATSMTAAIATGLGVDFGTHLIAHVRRRRRLGDTLLQALGPDYVVIGRACFFSAAALAVALAVVCVSSAPPLRWFGALIAAGAIGSLLGALVVIPATLGLANRFGKARP